MSRYDDLFDTAATSESVFADKSVLDPLAEPDEVVAREAQERDLATILSGIHEGYLPPTRVVGEFVDTSTDIFHNSMFS